LGYTKAASITDFGSAYYYLFYFGYQALFMP